MQWYTQNWNGVITTAQSGVNAGRHYKNHYAISIWVGLMIPLFVLLAFKLRYPSTTERKKSYLFKAWYLLSSLLPFACIIIGNFVLCNYIFFDKSIIIISVLYISTILYLFFIQYQLYYVLFLFSTFSHPPITLYHSNNCLLYYFYCHRCSCCIHY